MSADLRQRWEERARERGASRRSVLFQGLPETLNEQIHLWHAALVRDHLLPLLPRQGLLLDLGCGYGRMAAVVRRARPDLRLLGMDFSPAYCRLYRRDIGPVLCADLARPPLAEGCCDGLLAITCLMYLPEPARIGAVEQLLRLLRPGGYALLVDPGREFQSLIARLRPRSRQQTTGGSGFSQEEHRRLEALQGWRCIARGGNPRFTALLPLLLALAPLPAPCRWLGGLCRRGDRRSGRPPRYGLHRWLLLQRCP